MTAPKTTVVYSSYKLMEDTFFRARPYYVKHFRLQYTEKHAQYVETEIITGNCKRTNSLKLSVLH